MGLSNTASRSSVSRLVLVLIHTDIIPAQTLPVDSRRTLVLMAKVIQTAANSQRVGQMVAAVYWFTVLKPLRD